MQHVWNLFISWELVSFLSSLVIFSVVLLRWQVQFFKRWFQPFQQHIVYSCFILLLKVLLTPFFVQLTLRYHLVKFGFQFLVVESSLRVVLIHLKLFIIEFFCDWLLIQVSFDIPLFCLLFYQFHFTIRCEVVLIIQFLGFARCKLVLFLQISLFIFKMFLLVLGFLLFITLTPQLNFTI